jgi:molecular chaperone DnaK (HSP70)
LNSGPECGFISPVSKIVGIDLGTTNSLVATVDSAQKAVQVQIVKDVKGKK